MQVLVQSNEDINITVMSEIKCTTCRRKWWLAISITLSIQETNKNHQTFKTCIDTMMHLFHFKYLEDQVVYIENLEQYCPIKLHDIHSSYSLSWEE